MSVQTGYEHVACNLCGADDTTTLFEAIPDGERRTEKLADYSASGDSMLVDRLVQCRRCGLAYVNPRLDTKLIEQGYSEADNSTYLEQGSERQKTFSRVIHMLERRIPQKGKLLDVGCAGGFFVKAAQDAGWDAHGLEPSKHSCEYAREKLKVPVTQGVLRDRKFPEGTFDVVTMWDVLEHVGDPKQDLLETHRILKPGGNLLVNFPDFSSVWAKLLGRRWWFLINVHIYYFTPATLSKLLRETGFEPVDQRLHFQTLNLGYLLTRLRPYSKTISTVLSGIARLTRLERLPVTYYASQVNMISRRV